MNFNFLTITQNKWNDRAADPAVASGIGALRPPLNCSRPIQHQNKNNRENKTAKK